MRFGIGGALHVSRVVLEMLLMRVSGDVHASCHCVVVKVVLISSIYVSSFIWIVLVSKNCTWKFSRFAFGTGLSILGVVPVWGWYFGNRCIRWDMQLYGYVVQVEIYILARD